MLALRPYQEIGRDFLAARRHALLADEMRVGKTPQAILAAHKAGAKSLLVVTRAIAVPQWNEEIRRWWSGERLPAFKVYSYEGATAAWLEGMIGNADVFIPDECHFAKNPGALRTKMVYGKGGFAWHSGATWPLSGTPAPKHAGELWAMLYAFGIVKMTDNEFMRRYCTWNPETMRYTGTREEMIPELRELLAKCMLRRKRKDVAPEMPDISYDFLEIRPASVDLQVPDLPFDQMVEWLEANQTYDRENRIAVATAKVAPLSDEIEFAIENELYKQTVVFGWHIEPLQRLMQSLRAKGFQADVITGDTSDKSRQIMLRQFREGDTQVMIAQIITAGTAIDLSAASHGYFLELDWVPGNNVQAANRMIAMTKMTPVTIDVATWKGSTDDRVQRVLLRRSRELDKLY